MTDLRKAAEAVLEAWGWDWSEPRNEALKERMEALRQALAQSEQGNSSPNYPNTEPNTSFVDAVNMRQERVDETAKGEHEPFIYVREDNERPFGGYEHCSEADAGAFPVYTAPPKREWVGLTDEERQEIVKQEVHWSGICRAIETKLKEKNA